MHRYRVFTTCVQVGILMVTVWMTGCRADEPSCVSNDMCEENEVCGGTGLCEPRIVRQRARRELFHRFGADMKAYSLWLQYGTTGTSSRAVPPDTEHRVATTMDGRVSSHQHARTEDVPVYSETQEDTSDLNDGTTPADPNLLCSLEDVRTDDLTFHVTRAYPGGYWGEAPIEDLHAGRCGDDLETLAWRLLNCERLSRELPPLECDMRLVWISRQHADDMASREFFGHLNPDGHDSFHRLSGRGVQYGLAGENLARQTSVFNAHAAWMRSPLHRRNILTEQYQYAGIGIVATKKQLLLTETFIGGVDAPSSEPPSDEARLQDAPPSDAP